MKTAPYWKSTAITEDYPPLTRTLHTEVAVIGGGITGITTALLLQQFGVAVVLIERGKCMERDTGHTTAHLTYVTDTRLSDLVDKFGRNHAQAVLEAGQAAMKLIFETVRDQNIVCDFKWVPGYLHVPITGKHFNGEIVLLKKEARMAAAMGFDALFVDEVPLMKRAGIRFSNQAKFNPRKYLTALLESFVEHGGSVFEHTEAQDICDQPLQVITENGKIQCDFVVIATNVPLQGKSNLLSATLLQSKLVPYSSYVVGARIPRGLMAEASFWDTATPYNYLRIDSHETHDYAIFGGKDHRTGQQKDTRKCYRDVETALLSIVPKAKVDRHWSGQVIETSDGMPYIGETAPRQFVATGFCGNGMTFATVAAMMACDSFLGRVNPWRDLFSPNRKKLSAAWNYLKENADYPYYLVKDRLAKAEGKSFKSLKRNEGKILKIAGHKVAAFRDAHGKITRRSAVCSHLGCLVAWNDAEKTWDCPCHGSRFKATGEVIAGPAEDNLSKVK